MFTSVLLGELIRSRLEGIVEITDLHANAFEAHYELLLRWNQRMNLTTVTEVHEAAVRHYAESVFVASIVDEGPIVDVGSGPGFPGIPLAIAKPDFEVHLVESHQRKAVFLREATRELPNVKVLAMRAESILGTYAWLVSRAVGLEAIGRLRIARKCAVLCSEPDASVLNADRLIQLPWDVRRVVAVVSRETPCGP